MNNIIENLSSTLRKIVSQNIVLLSNDTVEIRLRVNSPILIKKVNSELFIEESYKIKKKDIDETVINFTKNSIHAFEKEIRSGYITIEGGHRVGIGGDCIYEKN